MIVLADEAYASTALGSWSTSKGATPNMPPKSNRKWKPCFIERLYRERNSIERFSPRSSTSVALPPATTNSPTTSSLWSKLPPCDRGCVC